ncbi:hypothetical protein BJY01DRAFT_218101 [Aspergillus pseudoustus]|uniref:Uncharacterized protein n=1 Tax=Aspergillus pseudoustus TaxID=1810923 RepID=A0ABR4JL62_9EURO
MRNNETAWMVTTCQCCRCNAGSHTQRSPTCTRTRSGPDLTQSQSLLSILSSCTPRCSSPWGIAFLLCE